MKKNSYTKKIALGSAQFGLDYGVSNTMGITSKPEVIKILEYAKSVGIDTIDTAQVYGSSESVLGDVGVEDWNVVSKFAQEKEEEKIISYFKKSTTRLKLNKLDAFISHNGQTLTENNFLWNELLELRDCGLIKKIGYSIYTTRELDNLLSLGFIPDLIQIPYNILDTRFEPYLEKMKDLGTEIHVRSAFLQGLFFYDLNNLHPFFNSIKMFLKEFNDKFPKNQDKVKQLLSFPLENKFIDKVVIGVNNHKQLKMNIESLSLSNNTNQMPYIPIINEELLLPYKWPH